jgi:hypothetical protein
LLIKLENPNQLIHCPPIGYISQNCKGLQKTLANKNASLCIYGKHNILAIFPRQRQGVGQGRGGGSEIIKRQELVASKMWLVWNSNKIGNILKLVVDRREL